MAPYVSEADFLKAVASGLQGIAQGGFQVQPWHPTIVNGSSTPCADVEMKGRNAASGETLLLRARVCYAKAGTSSVYMTLFSDVFAEGQSAETGQAAAFIGANSPK
jgi:hypothetical protein